jgi:LPXTG-motif cell wall-anchored protein
MYRLKVLPLAIAMWIASGAAGAQNNTSVDRAFTATEAKCDAIRWSQEALEKYPNIAEACQDVMERDGRYYVKFSGTVRRVRGQDVTVNFKNGSDALTVTAPENTSLYIDGRPRSVRNLRRGDELTFYVPQDQLVAPPPAVVGVTVIPITRIRVAQATPGADRESADTGADSRQAPELPKTASVVPLIGFSGLVLMILGIAPALLRRRRNQSGFNP